MIQTTRPGRRAPALASLLLLSLTLSSNALLARAQQPAQKAAQPAESKLAIAGLRADVRVRRDKRGVPYIKAADDADLYFAQGYVTASDRLWQMDLLRRTARGELAEIFGPAVLEEDTRRRRYGFARLAEALAAKASPELRTALESYARGVNAFISSLGAESLPQEFRILQYSPAPWRPEDSLVIGKLFAETLSGGWGVDLVNTLINDLPKERRDAIRPETSPLDVLLVGSDRPAKKQGPGRAVSSHVTPGVRAGVVLEAVSAQQTMLRSLERVGLSAEDSAASNNWVVSGRHTASGKPLLANDPHLDPSAPSIWHMAHLAAPGMRAAGVTFPGAPGIVIGHNGRIAWGVTNMAPDVQDLYLEKFDPENPLRYRTPAGWRDAEVRREEIKVRGAGPGGSAGTVTLDVVVTRHGPIFFEEGGSRFALRWTALDPDACELGAFLLINRARDWKQFRAALRTYPGPAQNFVYADVDGHIGYYGAGRIPVRKTGDGDQPYDGATDDGEWVSYVPFDALPHLYDPPSGLIVTANNRIVGLDYPYLLTHNWNEPYRAHRIHELLKAGLKRKLTVEDFRAIQGDTYSYPVDNFARGVVSIARPLAAGSPEWKAVLASFDGWDGRLSADSRTAPLAELTRDIFNARIMAGVIGTSRPYSWRNDGTFFDRVITTRPPELLPAGVDSYEALVLACYKQAVAELSGALGPDQSRWVRGNWARSVFPHPFAGPPLSLGQFAVSPQPMSGHAYSVNAGANVSMRFIADLSEWDDSRQGLPLGVSGDPSSPHWKDQLADWQAVTPRPFPFSPRAVAQAAASSTLLTPKP